MMQSVKVIAFDADDTLWHNEHLFRQVQTEFKTLLAQYHSPEWIAERLYATEIKNLPHYGYGVKAFALSMIETAVELTEGRVTGADIQRILDAARTMLTADVRLLDGVTDTLEALFPHYRLMVITKGDLLDQQAKFERSGLEPYFAHIEVVREKNAETYDALLKRLNIAPTQFMMVGNSMRSDILPVLEIGAQAVYVPHELTWEHEEAATPEAGTLGFQQITGIADLPALLRSRS
ncbi:MAG: HAD hydrolase-like protein [Natronospirillum sp.]